MSLRICPGVNDEAVLEFAASRRALLLTRLEMDMPQVYD